MEEQVKSLTKIGLTDKQAIVYSALLELGEAKMTHIARHAKLKRPTVYLVIEELIQLSLVSMIEKGKKKIYSAVHPNRITEILKSREKQFEELLPNLVARYGSVRGKPKVQMLEGIAGVRQAYQEAFALLANGKQEGLWMGNIGILVEHFPEVMREYNVLMNTVKRYRIREINFGGEASKQWVAKMNTKPKPSHGIKYVDDAGIAGSTDQLIVGNKVIQFSTREELFTLIIESEELAKTQRFLFEQIWKSN